MANRLIRYEAKLFRRSLGDGFRGPADIALLALLGIIAFAWLRDRATRIRAPALPPEALWFAVAAAPVGYTVQRLATQRLAWLAEHSPLAPDALESKARLFYLGAAHLTAGISVLAVAALLGAALDQPAAIGIAAASYAIGAGSALIVPATRLRPAPARDGASAPDPGSGRRAVAELVLRRQTGRRTRAAKGAMLLVAANLALTLAAALWGRGQPEALRIAATLLPSLAVLLMSSRLDAAMLGFLPYAGYGPAFIAAAVSALPAASFVASALAVLVTGAAANAGVLAILALGHLGFILIGIARAWLYPGRQARSVEVQLQLEGVGLLAIAVLLPPLAIAGLGWRLWRFRLHCRTQRWVQP